MFETLFRSAKPISLVQLLQKDPGQNTSSAKSPTATQLKNKKRIKFWTFSFNADLQDGLLGRDVLPKAEGGTKWEEEHGRIEILVSRKREQEAGHEHDTEAAITPRK